MSAPSVIACPKCGTKLAIEPSRKSRCPKCGALVTIRPAAVSPLPPPTPPLLSVSPPRTIAYSEVLSLDDEVGTPQARSHGHKVALAIVAGLLVAGGVAAGIYLSRDTKPAPDFAEAPAAKDPPAKEPPAKEPNSKEPPAKEAPAKEPTAKPKPVTPEPPKSNFVTFLPEPESPRELSGDEVYRRVIRSTAFILTADSRSIGCGSGILIDPDRRLVLTNEHVVGSHKKVIVLFPAYDSENQVIADMKDYKGKGIEANVLARSEKKDLALIQLDSLPSNVRPVGFAKPSPTGATIYSVGASGTDLEDFSKSILWRLSSGTVRGRAKKVYRDQKGSREYMCLETQSPVNPGDSGGPVVNGQVELVGIVASFRKDQRLVSSNVDITEVRDFVGDYFRLKGETWKEPETETELESSPGLPVPAAVFDNLIEVLKGGVPVDRTAAARRLGTLRAKGRAAVPALLAVLDGANEELQTAIASALTQIGARSRVRKRP